MVLPVVVNGGTTTPVVVGLASRNCASMLGLAVPLHVIIADGTIRIEDEKVNVLSTRLHEDLFCAR